MTLIRLKIYKNCAAVPNACSKTPVEIFELKCVAAPER